MTQQNLLTSIKSIAADGFTSEGIALLDNYAEHFISSQLVYQRFSPAEQHGCSAGGATHVIASLLSATKAEPDCITESITGFKREQQLAKAQEKIIYLSDMHDENVIRSKNGNIFVIDCDIRLNTPELRAGGRRHPMNILHYSN